MASLNVLKECPLTEDQINQLHASLDTDGCGGINYEDFLSAFRIIDVWQQKKHKKRHHSHMEAKDEDESSEESSSSSSTSRSDSEKEVFEDEEDE